MALGIRAHLTEPMGMEVSPQGGYVLYIYICVTPMAMYNVQIHHESYMVILYIMNTLSYLGGGVAYFYVDPKCGV